MKKRRSFAALRMTKKEKQDDGSDVQDDRSDILNDMPFISVSRFFRKMCDIAHALKVLTNVYHDVSI